MLVPKRKWYYDSCQLDAQVLQKQRCNPNDPDISISTQHTDKIEFSCTVSQKKKIPITKYSNILKGTKT
jgi:hypothetical protein